LAGWARSFGVHPQAAYRWFREDRMPVPARQFARGDDRGVEVSVGEVSGRAVVAMRVSSHDQRPDLEARAGRRSPWPLTRTSTGFTTVHNRAMRAVTATKRDSVDEVPGRSGAVHGPNPCG
jgi:predicted site-specific integrase-resolvase